MLKCALLDANIIIEAYQFGIWEKLIERVDISVSSIVAHSEALFYSKKEKRVPEPIDLKRLILKGKIEEFSATQEEIATFLNNFDRVFVGGLHDGEAESLALIMHGRIKDTFYCSGDSTAIQALAMIGHSADGISFERLLQKAGLQKRLRKQFTEKFFKEQIKEGQKNRITGQGLK